MRQFQQSDLLKPFYLAGGTGLALRLGHRRSDDLDFFSTSAFEEEALLGRLNQCNEFALLARSVSTLHANIRGTKVSFIGYPYPVLFPPDKFLGVDVADLRDVASMKISAVASRGTRRDFIDLFMVSQQHGLPVLLECFVKKFERVNYSVPHILKSLTYFDDAEQDPIPDMLVPLDWEEVKKFFAVEAPKLL
ncbi:MAG: nucleotidyl transferase AbiEii/AbiGii toxin family protein [Acidobacteria bacterium]|nr:nucleotidyl transferase AbiEii/AbiGii toxin family protein [Acidobacteriota bacterium]